MNVENSCATVVFTLCPLEMVKGGSLFTINMANRHKRPWLHLDVSRSMMGFARSLLNVEEDVREFDAFVKKHHDAWAPGGVPLMAARFKGMGQFTLNVAGSRESTSPGIYEATMVLLKNSKFLFTNHGQQA